MTVGEKIRRARLEKRITQSELCQGRITRNMLSSIERGAANPSIETLKFIADRLSLPVSYLVSSDDSRFFYLKEDAISDIRAAMREKNYKEALNLTKGLGGTDDECELIMAEAAFELGKAAVLGGSFKSGKAYLEEALSHAKSTVYDTEKIENSALLYLAMANNITAPLLELNVPLFEKRAYSLSELELYKYISLDSTHPYSRDAYRKHLEAKEVLRSRDYYKAIELLSELEGLRLDDGYCSYFILALYADLEVCYKQIGDFENAYRYASKRMAILEASKS